MVDTEGMEAGIGELEDEEKRFSYENVDVSAAVTQDDYSLELCPMRKNFRKSSIPEK